MPQVHQISGVNTFRNSCHTGTPYCAGTMGVFFFPAPYRFLGLISRIFLFFSFFFLYYHLVGVFLSHSFRLHPNETDLSMGFQFPMTVANLLHKQYIIGPDWKRLSGYYNFSQVFTGSTGPISTTKSVKGFSRSTTYVCHTWVRYTRTYVEYDSYRSPCGLSKSLLLNVPCGGTIWTQ
jgi:hypothetical protein